MRFRPNTVSSIQACHQQWASSGVQVAVVGDEELLARQIDLPLVLRHLEAGGSRPEPVASDFAEVFMGFKVIQRGAVVRPMPPSG